MKAWVWIDSTHTKAWCGHVCPYSPHMGGRDRKISGACGQANQDELVNSSERPGLKNSWGGDWERHQMPASGLTQELTHTYTNHRCTHGCESRCGPIPAFGKRKKGDQEFKASWCYLAILGASLSYIRSCLQTKKEQNKNEDVAEYGGLYVLSTRVAKACWSQVWGQPGLYRQTVS